VFGGATQAPKVVPRVIAPKVVAPVQTQAPSSSGGASMDKQIFDIINKFRIDPQSSIPELEKMAGCFKGDILELPGGAGRMRTMRGVKAVNEAIKWVQFKDKSPALKWCPGLTNGCKDLVTDIAPKGLI